MVDGDVRFVYQLTHIYAMYQIAEHPSLQIPELSILASIEIVPTKAI
jgi:hypothetical protein